jgi:L-threonylcarbamoyladenylate synthase
MPTEQEVQSIARAAEVIRSGGVVVYPTETAYGLGVDATNQAALERMYALKGMPLDKPTHIALRSMEEAARYAVVDARALALAKKFLPGPLTLVLPTRSVLPKILEESGKGERSFRIPSHPFALKLVEMAAVPITATSANKHGSPTTYSIEEVKKSFGLDFGKIDYILDGGALPKTEPSTLVSLMGPRPHIIRQGPIKLVEILAALAEI